MAYVASVEALRFLDSIDEFFTDDFEARENDEPPRIGRDVHLANEAQLLSRVRMESARALEVVVDGDRVVLHWCFVMIGPGDVRRVLDELVLQTWRGDRVASERYFYDPAQRTRRVASDRP